MESPTIPAPVEYRILALYRFVPLVRADNDAVDDDGGDETSKSTATTTAPPPPPPERHPTLLALRSELLTTLRRHDAKGTLLIAPEGINGTICYPWTPSGGEGGGREESGEEEDDDDQVAKYLKEHPLFGGPDLRTRLSVWKDEGDEEYDDGEGDGGDGDPTNESSDRRPVRLREKRPQQAFHRLKVKIKAEIVTLGLGRPLVDRKPVVAASDPPGNGSKSSAPPSTDANNDPAPSLPSHDRHASNRLADPLATKGTYLSPSKWDEACRDPDVIVIDTRNTYEIEIGTFENAVDPQTENFSDFPEYLERLAGEYDWGGDGEVGKNNKEFNDGDCSDDVSRGEEESSSNSSAPATKANDHLDPYDVGNSIEQSDCQRKKPPPKGIAMFCTGGIRCEKATSYAIQSGLFPRGLPIYHLEGGILAYLDDVARRKEDGKVEGNASSDAKGQEGMGEEKERRPSTSESTFRGECFVFDKRVAVTEGLRPSPNYVACHGCRGPMDRRLLLPPNEDDDQNTGENAGSNDSGDDADDEAVRRYRILAEGIPRLPSLRRDPRTGRHYLPGLTCPRCHSSATWESLERFAQRERQMEICAREGRSHFEDRGV